MNAALRERLIDLYAEVDAEVSAAGPKCESSGRCCRFKEWGHVLFVSAPEAEFLLESAPPYEKPVSPDGCPFQDGKLCTAREPRPLGCRIYFCDPAYPETGNAITERALAKLKQICSDENVDWRYAPLHVFLNEAARVETRSTEKYPDQRIALQLAENR